MPSVFFSIFYNNKKGGLVKMFKKLMIYICMFALCIMSVVPNVSAATTLPDPPGAAGMKLAVIYKYSVNNRWYAHYFDTSHGLEFSTVKKDGSNFSFSISSTDGQDMQHRYFMLDETAGVWNELEPNSGKIYNHYFKDSNSLYYVSTTLKNEDGSVFFSLQTMAEMILGVVKETIPIKVGTIHQQMMIIALCGVGCLALLILSPVLVKVLRRYLA